jgi:ligand-binding sensor domain-containing protein
MLARWKAKAAWFYAPSLLGMLFLSANPASAEHLPLRSYSTADGLVSNRISRIVSDSRGYLWFCTEGGLSRFDGHTFTNYTTEQGLPDNDRVNPGCGC